LTEQHETAKTIDLDTDMRLKRSALGIYFLKKYEYLLYIADNNDMV